MKPCDIFPSIVWLLCHVNCQVVFVPAEGGGASLQNIKNMSKFVVFNYLNIKRHKKKVCDILLCYILLLLLSLLLRIYIYIYIK